MSKRTMHVVRKAWSEHELATLRTLYPHSTGSALEAALGRSAKSIYGKAHEIGLQKSAEYLASQRSSRIKRGKQHPNMVATQFRPGHATWNKGIKGSTGLHPNCRKTQFGPRAPDEARNYLPIGSLRTTPDGYQQKKITDTGYPPVDWKAVHVLLWEEHHGPVPINMCVCFKDGNKAHIALNNLELLTRAERMRRNTIHRYPEELKSAIRAIGKLKRTIREVEHEEQD